MTITNLATNTVPAASTAKTTDTTALGRTNLATNFNTFLSLLTTQLKNQDPTAPLDSNQFTQQLTQMTGVEQQLDTNALLTKLVNNTSSGLSGAVSLIGKSVRAASDTTNINKGQAQWVFNLPTEAADSKIQVLDSTGKVVHSEAGGDIKAGDHGFTWNGKDASGNQLADGGPYTLQITATDSSGNAITAANYVDGIVTGVEQANGSTLLSINGGRVDASNVVSVQQVATTTTPTAPAAT